MGQSTSPNIPGTAGGSHLGAYMNQVAGTPAAAPDPAALAAYQSTFGNQPSFQQMANAHAMDLINKLPLQNGRYLVSPTNQPAIKPQAPLPQMSDASRQEGLNRRMNNQ